MHAYVHAHAPRAHAFSACRTRARALAGLLKAPRTGLRLPGGVPSAKRPRQRLTQQPRTSCWPRRSSSTRRWAGRVHCVSASQREGVGRTRSLPRRRWGSSRIARGCAGKGVQTNNGRVRYVCLQLARALRARLCLWLPRRSSRPCRRRSPLLRTRLRAASRQQRSRRQRCSWSCTRPSARLRQRQRRRRRARRCAGGCAAHTHQPIPAPGGAPACNAPLARWACSQQWFVVLPE